MRSLSRGVLLAAFASALVPPQPVSVPAWAAEHRVIAAGTSQFPGRWSNDFAPHLVEVMECLSLSHPCHEVVFRKSNQVGGTECALNLLGAVVDAEPAPAIVLLPTGDTVYRFVRKKLDPMIDATPVLKRKVAPQTSRDERGSTTTSKVFAGGTIDVLSASSSADLQMLSARVLILEEVSEYPRETEDGGDPVEQALGRLKGYWSIRKVFYNSTPAEAENCRITRRLEASDFRLRYVPCPQCGWFQPLRWPHMRWRSDVAPHGAYYVCQASGCIIEDVSRVSMNRRGVWIPTFDGGEDSPPPPDIIPPNQVESWRVRPAGSRPRGYHIWQAYSRTVSWNDTVAEYLISKDDEAKLKSFTLRALGEPWTPRVEAPQIETLLERRESWPPRRVPPGVIVLIGAVDVQGNRLVWTVWGFDRHFGQWLIDTGTIAGDPSQDEPWQALRPLLAQSWADAWGRARTPDAWGVDAGYLSQQVYRFVAAMSATRKVYALDGRPGWRLPPLGTATPRSIDYLGRKTGECLLWPVGTWDLKSELYGALGKTAAGPDDTGCWPAGAVRLSSLVDREFLEQITAETLRRVRHRSGIERLEWHKVRANEQLDLAVYARALARHETYGMTADDWSYQEAKHSAAPEQAEPSFFDLLMPRAADRLRVEAGDGEQQIVSTPPAEAARGRSVVGVGRRLGQ